MVARQMGNAARTQVGGPAHRSRPVCRPVILGVSGSRLASVLGVAVLAVLAGSTPALAAPPPAAPAASTAPAPAACGPGPAPAPRRAAGPVLAVTGLLPTLLGAVARDAAAVPPAPCPPARRPPTGRSIGDDTSAGVLQHWGAPSRVDEFDGTALGDGWGVYNGRGHGGNGRRTPKAVSVRDGILTITGDSRGNTAGMEWSGGQRYGRWEGRVRAPASDESYDALLLLWPDAENFPVGGEIDFMEMMDPARQKTNVFLHYGKHNDQISGEVHVDATQWHNWAVEWTPTHIATFLDGKQWWRTERVNIFPPGKMHLCVQLDWFPRSARGPVRQSTMQVDWVKEYRLGPADLARSAADDARRVAASVSSAARVPARP
jgi:Glycosyl hydrolases family 16